MSIHNRKYRLGKSLLGVGLGLAIVFAGSAALTSQPVQAAAASSSASSLADQIIATGEKYIGVPYKFGARSGQTDSFDCSSFTQYVYKQHGIDLPRSSKDQATVGTRVSKDQLQPGDLVFTDTNRDGVINHVSIYIGNGQLLHTYRVGIGVTISDFAGSTWDQTFVTARRVIPDDGQAAADNGQSASTASGGQSSADDKQSGSASDKQTTADNKQVPAADNGQSLADIGQAASTTDRSSSTARSSNSGSSSSSGHKDLTSDAGGSWWQGFGNWNGRR
ncbi:C40 family peptidase [Cohnella zeiphila]|uniref:C40 family peptidase n=1 Tax=Cohnella zeiphila TaxID=2761120 RepID=A0A7X0VX78_9BACL|nr:C40 family peptidase [Cohnella zeiphila]MBB6733731.1 C40 family peptidase [Cohnella zeiphila]